MTPESISPTLWNGENREDILAFLGDLNGAYLFYKVMKNDPDAESSAIDEANAAKVDKITNLQKAQYLSQADSMYQPTSSSPTWSVRHSPGSPWQMQSRSRSTAMSPLFSRCPILKNSLSGPQRSTAPCPRIRSQLLRQTGTAWSTGRLACISNR